MPIKNKYTIAVISAFSIIGALLLLLCTKRWGIGVSEDTSLYLFISKQILSNKELKNISANTSVLYPIILALLGFFTDPMQWIRWINAFLFGGSIFLAGFIVKRYTNSFWLSVLGSLLTMTSSVLISAYCVALTEPIFIFLIILGVYTLAEFFEKEKRLLFIVAIICMSLSFMIKKPGIVFIATAVIGFLFLSKKSAKLRFYDMTIFAFFSYIPTTALHFIRKQDINSIFNRVSNITSISKTVRASKTAQAPSDVLVAIQHIAKFSYFDRIKKILEIFSTWFFMYSITNFIIAILLITVLVLWVLKRRDDNFIINEAHENDSNKPISNKTILLLISFSISSYLLAIILFLHPTIDINNRFLSPIYILGVILALCCFNYFLPYLKKSLLIKNVFIALIIVFSVASIARASKYFLNMHKEGNGFTGKKWTEANEKLRQDLESFPKDIKVYTNSFFAIYYLTGIEALAIPDKVLMIYRLNPYYKNNIQKMKSQMENKKAILVYLPSSGKRINLSDNDFQDNASITVLKNNSYGTIYGSADFKKRF